ncbi:tRNA 2-thiouridine(34) synthase MnmA [Patescibacteria group bacterium]
MKEKNKKVVCAMSGGVDSSLSAAILKKKGFEVIGIFMKLTDLDGQKKGEKRARKVAKILKIHFLVLDLRKEFKKRIVNYFLSELKKGLTPNPCVVCNKEIKFGLLMEKALHLGANFIATGHYVRIRSLTNKKSITNKRINKFLNLQSIRYSLMTAKYKKKDQSYFLWKLKQHQLKRLIFPIGKYTKKKVRQMTKEMKLPVFNTSESQEICFIPKEINSFLKIHLKNKKGKIIDIKGKVLGEHEGLVFYTIGQRKGIKLSGGPFYVLDKNLKKNRIVVTKNEKDLLKKEIFVKDVNWVTGKELKLPLKAQVKIRYRNKAMSAVIKKISNTKYQILFSKHQRAVTPGQSAVFYKKEELLGGGIII